MKAIFFGLYLGLFFFSAPAQKFPVKFGEISISEMAMRSYEKDSTASAVVLADYGESAIVFNKAGEIIYIDPFISGSYKNNPFKSEIREYPVDFGSPAETTFFLKLTVPDNYVIDELPKSKIIAMPEMAQNISTTFRRMEIRSY